MEIKKIKGILLVLSLSLTGITQCAYIIIKNKTDDVIRATSFIGFQEVGSNFIDINPKSQGHFETAKFITGVKIEAVKASHTPPPASIMVYTPFHPGKSATHTSEASPPEFAANYTVEVQKIDNTYKTVVSSGV